MNKAKKMVALVLSVVVMSANAMPVSADIAKRGSMTRGGSGTLSGHYVTTTFEWVINNKKTKVKSSAGTQSEHGSFAEAVSVKKQNALSSEKKHVYYSKTKFTFSIATPWGSIVLNRETYTDKATLNGSGNASVDWGI